MSPESCELWIDYLVGARWFQGKGLAVEQREWRCLPWFAADGDVLVRSELAVLRVGDTIDTYHLLVGYLPPGTAEPSALVGQVELEGHGLVDMVDAPCSPTAMAAFLRAITTPGRSDVTWFAGSPDPQSPTQVFGGEQSNTTVRIGSGVLLKIFRRLSPGPNLESITLAALAPSAVTPQLIGTLDGDGVELGVFVERILDARDGWEYCVECCKNGRSIAEDMTHLGATLRRLHASMAAAFGTSSIDAADIGHTMAARLDAAAEQLPELADAQPRLRRLLRLHQATIPVQRVHGDFHLGQTLISPKGWTIIDFEGEPMKTPAERVAPDSVWRDVAGLLRSLDCVRQSHTAPTGESANRWYQDARAAFLDGYVGSADPSGRLLTAYEVDKAIYELLYETRNRPDWAAIPRAAIMAAAYGA